ncbi:MAG: putative transport system ATP-binding protein [Candidatus Woesearchaeota archaeon]|nr:putative transport system ATP-binding protein [Candidatus Woesearchaeota archaeon]MDN5327593.1 putative transport system ATP-binding protein [Candidatus Woesearchaeota archaeon]
MKPEDRAVIKLRNVYKIYKIGENEVKALRGVSLDINQGEMVAILGPSGAGKSTLMNMVGCLDIPTKGDIYLFGKNIAHLHESDLATLRGKKIGFIFQQFNLIPYLTALENVTLPMLFQGKSRKERIKRGLELLKIVELENRANHKPNELSGGQQQRVAIARALANDPDIILADEPTGNLDTKTGSTIMDFLKDLNKRFKKTIVIVTHDPRIGNQCQRQIFIKDGQIVDAL